MRIFYSIEEASVIKRPVLTLGTFDGVHLGHVHVINQLNSLSEKLGGESTLLTFEPHPRIVLHPENHGLKLIQTFEEKRKKLESEGLQNLICLNFTTEFSNQTGIEFIEEILVKQLNIQAIVIGHDHHFGKNRSGDFELLVEQGKIHNFDVFRSDAFIINETTVSSTKIRNALIAGEIETANTQLDEPYTLTGKVVSDQKLGRTIGFPTANIENIFEHKLIPMHGVYAVRVTIGAELPSEQKGTVFEGMCNIGTRPTVSEKEETKVEVHLFDFNQDIYGEEITLHFYKKIRNEKRFNSLDELQNQLHDDASIVRQYFAV